MKLQDRAIKGAIANGKIVIRPLDEADIQPASVDLHLAAKIIVFDHSQHTVIDVRGDNRGLTHEVYIPADKPYIIHPGDFILASTTEWIEISDDIVAHLEGKSSLGRIGLMIHATAGVVDPGWIGNLTLEISNIARLPITLYRGMPIGQIDFTRLEGPAERPYGSESLGSKYQGQSGVAASKLGEVGGVSMRDTKILQPGAVQSGVLTELVRPIAHQDPCPHCDSYARVCLSFADSITVDQFVVELPRYVNHWPRTRLTHHITGMGDLLIVGPLACQCHEQADGLVK